jgi:hypothetical protein
MKLRFNIDLKSVLKTNNGDHSGFYLHCGKIQAMNKLQVNN